MKSNRPKLWHENLEPHDIQEYAEFLIERSISIYHNTKNPLFLWDAFRISYENNLDMPQEFNDYLLSITEEILSSKHDEYGLNAKEKVGSILRFGSRRRGSDFYRYHEMIKMLDAVEYYHHLHTEAYNNFWREKHELSCVREALDRKQGNKLAGDGRGKVSRIKREARTDYYSKDIAELLELEAQLKVRVDLLADKMMKKKLISETIDYITEQYKKDVNINFKTVEGWIDRYHETVEIYLKSRAMDPYY